MQLKRVMEEVAIHTHFRRCLPAWSWKDRFWIVKAACQTEARVSLFGRVCVRAYPPMHSPFPGGVELHAWLSVRAALWVREEMGDNYLAHVIYELQSCT